MIKNLVVTGYQPMEMSIFNENDERITFVKEAIKKRLLQFIDEGLEWVLISGQRGVELWTAEVVLDLKEDYDIQIAMIPPFENFAQRWSEALQYKFEELSFQVDYYETIYHSEYKGPYQFVARDDWLIQRSEACLLLMDEEFPGSVDYFYQRAKKAENYPTYFITPFDIDEVIREKMMDDPNYWGM